MKIVIDNLHIEKFITSGLKPVSRETPEPNRILVGRQRDEIAALRRAVKDLGDINQSLHKTEKIQNERMLEIVEQRDEAWNERDNIAALREEIDRLRKERDELLDAATKPTTTKPTTTKPTTTKGKERKHRKTLTDEEVWMVRRLLKNGRSNVWIERQKGIPAATVWKIKAGRTYTHVPPEPPRKPVKVHAGEGVITND